ncbi:hypothetical protein [Leifsonia shinshuensis]|uniref:Uncharacterized protein n=1 Tax=Leifsonia shinshuensis TaxID=150026 RepID=A0A853CSC0_9MICO|nr:hypothetical protein [Leifsonia shinshuensis]NYJ23258.1 hypothetical protein [Leifsonia shinshuensis]
MSDRNKPDNTAQPDDADRPDSVEQGDDYDLEFEKDVAPEENIPWLPHPSPTDGEAPAP